MNTTIELAIEPTDEHAMHDVQWIGSDGFGMPGNGQQSLLPVAASGVRFVPDTCALVDGWTVATDAARTDFPGTPAWSPPI